jgi:KDO2-lipid IV(A) lauroyltransferase
MTAPALVDLARKFKVPAYPARIERLDGARFRITVLPPIRF